VLLQGGGEPTVSDPPADFWEEGAQYRRCFNGAVWTCLRFEGDRVRMAHWEDGVLVTGGLPQSFWFYYDKLSGAPPD
jgi:hypothetical protein